MAARRHSDRGAGADATPRACARRAAQRGARPRAGATSRCLLAADSDVSRHARRDRQHSCVATDPGYVPVHLRSVEEEARYCTCSPYIRRIERDHESSPRGDWTRRSTARQTIAKLGSRTRNAGRGAALWAGADAAGAALRGERASDALDREGATQWHGRSMASRVAGPNGGWPWWQASLAGRACGRLG